MPFFKHLNNNYSFNTTGALKQAVFHFWGLLFSESQWKICRKMFEVCSVRDYAISVVCPFVSSLVKLELQTYLILAAYDT